MAKADLEFKILSISEITGGLPRTQLTLYSSGAEMCPLFPRMGVLLKGGGWDLSIDPRQVLFWYFFGSTHLALPQAHKVSAHSQS